MPSKPNFILMGLPKPAARAPCSGCGYCCTAQPCALANEYLNCHQGPCVALEWEGGRSFCGLVRSPGQYLVNKDIPPALAGPLQAHLASALGLGVGCDADDDSESEAWSAARQHNGEMR
jgi:hypothetical protein